jgi:uncharacterized membrane protein YedE/YeeE
MIILAVALLSGLVFGLGLILSGMTDPAKVLAFLDVAGSWDPSLALVMLGAISIGFFAFRAAKRRGQTLLSTPLRLPVSRTIDHRLVLGSLLFGIGWGLAGLCPGPGLVLAASGHSAGIVFVTAMLLGMAVFDGLERYRQKRSDRQPENIGRQ